jgi:hypothetical protein
LHLHHYNCAWFGRAGIGIPPVAASSRWPGIAARKSLLIYGRRVKTQNKKYFAFPEGRNSGISIAIPSREEGRIMIVTNVGRGAVDAEVPATNGIEAYGKDVWS